MTPRITVAPPPYPPRMTPAEEALAAKYGIDPRYYVIRGQKLIELHPDHCPAGHVLSGGSYVVGWRACLCVDGHTGHRLWICDCGEETGWPGCSKGGFEVWGGVGCV